MDLQLNGKVALVTGGTAGIGFAIAEAFLKAGAKVAIVGRDEVRGNEALLKLKKEGEVQFFQGDVASYEEAERIVTSLLEKEGRLDILVNNAGITIDKLLLKMTPDDWDQVMDVNVKSCYNFCRAAVRAMLKARRGKIINMSSVVGIYGNPGQTNYAASKAAMIGFTKALAKELGSRSINVNCIAPGFVESSMTGVLTEEQRNSIQERVSLKRLGSPNDVANCALFLASELSDYITGEVIAVDGGFA